MNTLLEHKKYALALISETTTHISIIKSLPKEFEAEKQMILPVLKDNLRGYLRQYHRMITSVKK